MSDKRASSNPGDGSGANSGGNNREQSDSFTVRRTRDSEEFGGETRFFDTVHLPLKNETGHTIGTLGISRDITEEKKTQEALTMNEELFRTIFEDNPIDMAMLDVSLHFTAANKAFRKMLGYDEEEISLLSFLDVVSTNVFPEDLLEFQKDLAGDIPFHQSIVHYKTKNNEEFLSALTINPLYNRDKKLLGILLIFQAPDQHIGVEDNGPRPILPHRAQLMEILGTLATGIAHDFNNALTTVIGFTSLMQEKMDKDDPGQAYLTKILTSSKKAAALTRNLLTFGRNQPVDLKPSKINNILRESTRLLRQVLSGSIELKVILTDDNPTVMADVAQVNHVLITLANNACEAMPQGGTLRIESQVLALDREFQKMHGFGESGNYVLISVSDDGIGMDEKTQRRIFEPFFTTKGMGECAGLGLASAYRIIKRHDGYITVASKPGSGSTFSIYLPLVVIQIEQRPFSTKDTSDIHVTGTFAFANKKGVHEKVVTVLIAEDNPTVRELIVTALQEHGYVTIETTDRQEAMRVFAENCSWIDFVILGETVPIRHRIELLKEMLTIRPKTKTFFVGGSPDEINAVKDLKNNKVEFISKPLILEDFLFRIEKTLNNHQD